MQLYRFSPIKTESELMGAITHVAAEATKLKFKVSGDVQSGLIESLTIFSHYLDEFERLKKLAASLGAPYNENNGPRIQLHHPIVLESAKLEVNNRMLTITNTIKYLRIRQPDPYRMQVGCCDFTGDYTSYYDYIYDISSNNKQSPRLIKREDYDMLEFFDPDVDVLAYAVSS